MKPLKSGTSGLDGRKVCTCPGGCDKVTHRDPKTGAYQPGALIPTSLFRKHNKGRPEARLSSTVAAGAPSVSTVSAAGVSNSVDHLRTSVARAVELAKQCNLDFIDTSNSFAADFSYDINRSSFDKKNPFCLSDTESNRQFVASESTLRSLSMEGALSPAHQTLLNDAVATLGEHARSEWERKHSLVPGQTVFITGQHYSIVTNSLVIF